MSGPIFCPWGQVTQDDSCSHRNFPSSPSYKEKGHIQAALWELPLAPDNFWTRDFHKITKSSLCLCLGPVLFASRCVSTIYFSGLGEDSCICRLTETVTQLFNLKGLPIFCNNAWMNIIVFILWVKVVKGKSIKRPNKLYKLWLMKQ